MNKHGVLVYKCRRCGKLDKNTHCPEVSSEVIHITVTGSSIKGRGIMCNMIGIHTCKDGNIGVTDLIGGENDD